MTFSSRRGSWLTIGGFGGPQTPYHNPILIDSQCAKFFITKRFAQNMFLRTIYYYQLDSSFGKRIYHLSQEMLGSCSNLSELKFVISSEATWRVKNLNLVFLQLCNSNKYIAIGTYILVNTRSLNCHQHVTLSMSYHNNRFKSPSHPSNSFSLKSTLA